VREELGVYTSLEDFVAAFREVRALTEATPDASDPAMEFPVDERAVLERAGASFASIPAGTADPVQRTRVAFAALLADTLSVDEAAARLGRDPSRIRQRIRDRSLWAIATDGGSRLPRIQFADAGAEIPGMGPVLKALPASLHPVSIVGWLTRPKPDLEIGGMAVSPRDWLLAGGGPDEVVALAEDLHVA
jgi:hypothetical protein